MRSLKFIALLVVSLALVGVQIRAAEPKDSAAGAPIKVLFIGNSLTFYNKLPDMTKYLAAHAAKPLEMEVDSHTVGGAKMEKHWKDGEALKKIQKGGWTYVVLQGLSTEAVSDKEGLFKHIRLFDAEIKKTGAKTLLYMTWALQKTPKDQPAITAAYYEIGKEIGARVIPVGVARESVLKAKPDAPIYVPDGKHPTPQGTYLAACLFYAMLSGNSPKGLPANVPDAKDAKKPLAALTAEEAAFYQDMAEQTAKAEASK